MGRAWSVWMGVIVLTIALCSCSSGNATSIASTIKATPPPAYASKVNPYSGQEQAAAEGKTIYDANCATCHGETGKGDGPGGALLNPKPADLTRMSPAVDSDAYIFWRVSEGGAFPPFNSAMPAWKTVLNENQIWQVVTYLRTLEK